MLDGRPQIVLAPLPRCAVLVDRHVHKNGGSTMRAIFAENDYRDGWMYWGYGLDHLPQLARSLTAALDMGGNGTACASWDAWARRPPLRLAAELHYGNTYPGLRNGMLRHVGPSSALARAALRCNCKMVLVTRVREPLSYYISFWRWAKIDLKQRQNASIYGATMIEWATTYRNLQSTLILGQANLALGPEYVGVRTPRAQEIARDFHGFEEPAARPAGVRGPTEGLEGRARVEQLRRSLRAFDVVGPLERFEETLLLISGARPEI